MISKDTIIRQIIAMDKRFGIMPEETLRDLSRGTHPDKIVYDFVRKQYCIHSNDGWWKKKYVIK